MPFVAVAEKVKAVGVAVVTVMATILLVDAPPVAESAEGAISIARVEMLSDCVTPVAIVSLSASVNDPAIPVAVTW
jgi:hypothetical protein